LARLGLWNGQFEPGEPTDPIRITRSTGSPVMVGVLVCVDSSYPALARRLRKRGARLLVIVSNEAGTGSWSARIHARIARFRAVETRSPIVGVGNAGPTRWIDARGRVLRDLALGAPAAAAQDLPLAGPPPPAVYLGDAPVVASALGLGLAAAGIRMRTRRRVPQDITLELPKEKIS
jgi:apolipoprotein N-acyltransferase